MTNQPIRDQMDEADLIVHHAKVTTLQDNGSEARGSSRSAARPR